MVALTPLPAAGIICRFQFQSGLWITFRRMPILAAIIMIISVLMQPARATTDAAVEAMQDYLNFAEYNDGIIMPEQIDEDIFNAVVFIDTRSVDQHDTATIPGAAHIEWREVMDRIDEIPTKQKTILFCNTGSLSAQAVFALRVAGRENVLVLQSGFEGWQKNAGWKP